MSTTAAHPQATSTSPSTSDDPLRTFVHSHTAGELIFNRRKLISVDASLSLADVLQILNTEQIRAVPVYKRVAGAKQYIGIVSAYDIVSYIAMSVSQAAHGGEAPSSTTTSTSGAGGGFGEVTFSLDRFDKVPVSDLFALDVNLSIENSSLWSLEPTDLLATVIDYFAKGIHRVLVHQRSDKTGKWKFNLLTQTDVIRFLHQHISELGSVFTTRLEELNMCNPQGLQRKLYGLTVNHSALDAFLLMHREVLHALPVVDDQGTLVTTLSTADTKGLNRSTLPNLMLPVTQFLKKQHQGRLLHPITGKSRDTLKDIIARMLIAEVHRHQVWITDAAERPIEVVTMTDVLRKVHEQIIRQSPA